MSLKSIPRFQAMNVDNHKCKVTREMVEGGSSHYSLAGRLEPDEPAPSLRSHYRAFITTTSWSAPVPRIGTQTLGGLPPWVSPLTSGRRVPTFRAGAASQVHAACTPDAARAVSRFPPDFSRSRLDSPGFDAVPTLSTLRRRFTLVRLPGSHLTESSVCLFLDAHHHGSLPQQLKVV